MSDAGKKSRDEARIEAMQQASERFEWHCLAAYLDESLLTLKDKDMQWHSGWLPKEIKALRRIARLINKEPWMPGLQRPWGRMIQQNLRSADTPPYTATDK